MFNRYCFMAVSRQNYFAKLIQLSAALAAQGGTRKPRGRSGLLLRPIRRPPREAPVLCRRASVDAAAVAAAAVSAASPAAAATASANKGAARNSSAVCLRCGGCLRPSRRRACRPHAVHHRAADDGARAVQRDPRAVAPPASARSHSSARGGDWRRSAFSPPAAADRAAYTVSLRLPAAHPFAHPQKTSRRARMAHHARQHKSLYVLRFSTTDM
jgi:hypothetical protein